MYEEFLEKSLNSKRQAVDDTFIAKYADLSLVALIPTSQSALARQRAASRSPS